MKYLKWKNEITMSVWAWYCIVTIPIKIWLHCNSKQPSMSSISLSLFSFRSKESATKMHQYSNLSFLSWLIKQNHQTIKDTRNYQLNKIDRKFPWFLDPKGSSNPKVTGSNFFGACIDACCPKEALYKHQKIYCSHFWWLVCKRKLYSTKSDLSADKSLVLFSWNHFWTFDKYWY